MWREEVDVTHSRRTIPPTAGERGAMRTALDLAAEAARAGESPVGAVVQGPDGEIVGVGRNERESSQDPTAHAEVVAIREAAAHLGRRILADCTLTVTLEPCVMCAGTILAARIPRVVFGAWDPKAGAAGSVYDLLRDGRLPAASPEVIAGVEEDASAALLQRFFSTRRAPSGE